MALIALLPEAKSRGLNHVEITANVTNLASARVIAKAGGVLVKRYMAREELGGRETLLFKIML